tara:strand:+ start:199 stop:396 length:198 start_codon:yes stop_codon:yes gene_type:complete
MASEIFAQAGSDVAIRLTPGGAGVLKVEADGEIIYDKAVEGNFPDLPRVKEIRAAIQHRLESVTV